MIRRAGDFMAELTRTSPLRAHWEAGRPATLTEGSLVITERPFLAKRVLRGAPADWQRALRSHLGLELPGPNRVTRIQELYCLWLRPDEWLLVDGTEHSQPLEELSQSAREIRALSILDVSDRFTYLEVRGEGGGDLLNGGCSVDFSEAAFPVGSCCQTRIEEVPV